jgi:glycosyltransferase involved in cell wall biosynthesis
MHFVSGGFSGSTQVAMDLVSSSPTSATLVLRLKRQTSMMRIAALRNSGIDVEFVPGWSRAVSVWHLVTLLKQRRPDILVSHGFPEHLIGRIAGLWAKVPHLIQVEHNSRERYSLLSKCLVNWLAPRTEAFVGCSQAVKKSLISQGLPASKCHAIPNGIRIPSLPPLLTSPTTDRRPNLLMVARFASQKDHLTLVKGLARLRELYALTPKLVLVGGGKERYRRATLRLVKELRLEGQIEVHGPRQDVRDLMQQFKLLCLSSHYEGMPLTLIEGMAAGCTILGSQVPGIEELISDGVNGTLVQPQNPDAWAHAIAKHLLDPEWSEQLAKVGQNEAMSQYNVESMITLYEVLFSSISRTYANHIN